MKRQEKRKEKRLLAKGRSKDESKIKRGKGLSEKGGANLGKEDKQEERGQGNG